MKAILFRVGFRFVTVKLLYKFGRLEDKLHGTGRGFLTYVFMSCLTYVISSELLLVTKLLLVHFLLLCSQGTLQRIILYVTENLLFSDNFANVRHILSSILVKKQNFRESVGFKINTTKTRNVKLKTVKIIF